jgi:uncharacterized glyoxalase superfamily protein PhnB
MSDSYQRGNDFRYIAIEKRCYRGMISELITDMNNTTFIKTPDGYWIRLIDSSNKQINDNNENSYDNSPQNVVKSNDCISFISLHVSNLKESIAFYSTVLNAHVMYVQNDTNTNQQITNKEDSFPRAFISWDSHSVSFLSKGIEFTENPRQESFGQVVVFKDKYGNKWDLIESKFN